jgi:inosine/xanthosine triphosphate pyrophosphatase family protein
LSGQAQPEARSIPQLLHHSLGHDLGTIASSPRGGRDFYWDTVFCPDDGAGKAYSEIAAGADGIQKKMALSQSTKAFMQMFEHLLTDTDTLFED